MKIYLTTYRNYNEGKPAAGWLDLDTFKDVSDFHAAINRLARTKLHDPDPEWMVCDWEQDAGADWQEGIATESRLPLEYWTLKAEEQAKAKRKSRRAKGADEQDALVREYMAGVKGYCPDFGYLRKSYRYVRLTGGEIVEAVPIPGIETRFCCGEDDRGQGGEKYGTMAYALKVNAEKRTERGFYNANLQPFKVKMIQSVGRHAWRKATGREAYADTYRTWTNDYVPALYRADGGYMMIDNYLTSYYRNTQGQGHGIRRLNDEDFRRLRAAWLEVYEQYKKRLRAYLKRFGTSKVHTWTYWTEA
jgi:hypothetical protein